MSIQDEINRISQAKDDLASAIESKGVTVPPNTTINLYPGLVQQIQQGDSLPEGGTPGQVLTKTENGVEWSDAPSGGGGVTVEPFIITDDWVEGCYQNCYRIGNIAHIEISNGNTVQKYDLGIITFPDSIKVDQSKRGSSIGVGIGVQQNTAGNVVITGQFSPMFGNFIALYDFSQLPLTNVSVFQINFSFPIQE